MGAIDQCDIAIAGGGLAGGLIALALRERQPGVAVRLVEPGALGGNHVWSFFDSDVAPEHRWLVEPLVCYHWPKYDIAFPAHSRTISAGYNSIESDRFDAVLRERLTPGTVVEATAEAVTRERIVLGGGRSIEAKLVIDARGPGDVGSLDLGWQKFLGQALRVSGGHRLERPVIMDSTVDQSDGYRFVYCLPFDAETVFVEDTYYSEGPALDADLLRRRIADYAAARGWQVSEVGREESGVLPVAMGGDIGAYLASGGDAGKAGMRGALFHPTTGYSLPDAVRLAAHIAAEPRMSAQAIDAWAQARWEERGFYRMLDSMLFRAAEPDKRYKVLERFYRLSPALIGRFYASRSTLADKIRILSGKPPVPIGRAVRAILDSRT